VKDGSNPENRSLVVKIRNPQPGGNEIRNHLPEFGPTADTSRPYGRAMTIPRYHPIYALRQQLAAEITRSLGGAPSQFVEAPYFGIPQPRMSELSRGIVDRCTVEWLIRRIYNLGGSVTITVTLGDATRLWWRAMRERSRARRAQRS
jgi:predicted XRE-type DNA-binding protein